HHLDLRDAGEGPYLIRPEPGAPHGVPGSFRERLRTWSTAPRRPRPPSSAASTRCGAAGTVANSPSAPLRGPDGGPPTPGPPVRRPRYPARGPDRPPPRRAAARSTRRRPVKDLP